MSEARDLFPRFIGATIDLLVGYSIRLSCHLILFRRPGGHHIIVDIGKSNKVLVYMFISNRSRDKRYGPANKEASDEAGMTDLTEFENKDFRCAL